MTTLIILNEEIDDIMKIVKTIKDSGLLIKGASETIENEAKEQKGRLFSMLLGTLGDSLLGNILTVKGVKPKMPEEGVTRVGEAKTREEDGF